MEPTTSSKNGPDPHWLQRRANQNRTHFGRGPNRVERSREELLLDWYGEKLAPGEIAARQKPARPVSEVVDGVLAKLGLREAALLEQVERRWSEIVGADVSRYTRPVAVRRTSLDIETESSTWQYVLQREHKHRILARIEDLTGGGITDIRFVPPGRHAGKRP